MKKVKTILCSIAASTLVAGALVSTALVSKRESKITRVNATEVETYIPMESSFFTNWTDAAGTFAGTDARFWGESYSFEALDTFFRGETAESWTGTLTSRTWKQSTQYIYFQLGGAKDYDVTGDPVHLKIHYGDQFDVFYNNTFIENPMMFRYYKIPDNVYANLMNGHDDFDMYIEIIDAQTAGYGFANFGYLHVNQTLESTSDAMRYYLNHLSTDSREWEINKRKQIFNNFYTNEGLKEVFLASVTNIDDSFDTNADFTKHWYFDHNFFNNDYGAERHFDAAISTNTFRPDAPTNMPFNNDGGFFRGWYEDSDGNGFVASDGLRYRFVSRPFVLSGTGIVSIKMAGKASLHVIDATVHNTDTQAGDLAWIDNRGFQMDGNNVNMAESGFNTTAMVNHVINLEAYVGKKIQLAICDYDTSGWSACYFDELVSNYTSAPAYHVDVATQTNNSGTFYPSYPDYYINSANISGENPLGVKYNGGNSVNTADDSAILNHVDGSASLGSYNVWKSYLDVVRNGKQGKNYCSSLVSDDVKGVINAYKDLSAAAKQLVCGSDDFERVGSGDWYSINPTIYGADHAYNIGRSIQYLAQENGIAGVAIYSNNSMLNPLAMASNPTLVIVISIVATVSASLLVLCFVLKKKRKHN